MENQDFNFGCIICNKYCRMASPAHNGKTFGCEDWRAKNKCPFSKMVGDRSGEYCYKNDCHCNMNLRVKSICGEAWQSSPRPSQISLQLSVA
jgi:hypothetical protein